MRRNWPSACERRAGVTACSGTFPLRWALRKSRRGTIIFPCLTVPTRCSWPAKARRARRADSADAGGERSICTDMALIRRELREKDPPKGAFCQDYETFKQIYRFVERGLKRSGQSAYIILMTLTDAQGQFVPLAAREEYMSRLSDDLQASLRSGDLFAPYSGCQYLLMVLGASSENAAVIAGRIHTRFMSRVAPDAGLLLRYDVYPMGELPLQPKG